MVSYKIICFIIPLVETLDPIGAHDYFFSAYENSTTDMLITVVDDLRDLFKF